jgi:uncharacterized protein (TIGR00730 family)
LATLTSLCVYCGSSSGVDTAHRDAAARLGRLLAERGVRLVYGGGGIGLMGIMADAALAADGSVTGIIPDHLQEREVGHDAITEMIVVGSMHARKRKMFELADAFAVLPGGMGTLDEALEVITWRQLALHDKPVVLVDNAGYWAPLMALIDHAIGAGFASPSTRRLFTVVDTVEAIFDAVARAPEPTVTTHESLL